LLYFCAALAGIQIIYLLLFFYAFHKKRMVPVHEPHPVSVIVCAHDEEQNLKELIPQLLAQKHPEFEVIIVEDRSNDGTYDYLLEATQLDSRLKMVRVTHKPDYINGKKFAITLGVRAAKYEWLLFTDADCRPDNEHWIANLTSQYDADTQVVLGYSPYKKSEGILNAFIRFESLLTGIQYMGMALLGKPYMGVGRNLAYTKSLFLQSKGFNNYVGVMGGDDDLFVNIHAQRANTQVCVGLQSTTHSTPKNTWAEYLNQKLRHLHAGKRYKFSDKAIIGLFMSSWLLMWFVAAPAFLLVNQPGALAALWFVRWILLAALFYRASRRLGGDFEWWKTPLLDFIFPFYYLVTGLRALVAKRIRWKN
jgi:glycosyltransferase involved in cell wall biosynthesis